MYLRWMPTTATPRSLQLPVGGSGCSRGYQRQHGDWQIGNDRPCSIRIICASQKQQKAPKWLRQDHHLPLNEETLLVMNSGKRIAAGLRVSCLHTRTLSFRNLRDSEPRDRGCNDQSVHGTTQISFRRPSWRLSVPGVW
jgi:hypothetical protein